STAELEAARSADLLRPRAVRTDHGRGLSQVTAVERIDLRRAARHDAIRALREARVRRRGGAGRADRGGAGPAPGGDRDPARLKGLDLLPPDARGALPRAIPDPQAAHDGGWRRANHRSRVREPPGPADHARGPDPS